MIYTVTFVFCLLATATVMGLTLSSGLRGRRKVHLRRALTTVLLLALTVLFAWLMSVHERRLPSREMGIHRIFSVTVAVVVPLVAATGVMLWRNPRWRWSHRLCVAVLVLATLGALGTGIWVLALSTAR